jgi:hypothetical protein
MKARFSSGVILAALALGSAASPAPAGRIQGHARFEKIKGKPAMGYV